MREILEQLRLKHTACNPEAGGPAGGEFTSFFHINNPHYFPAGSAELVETGWPPELHIASQQYRGQQCGPIRR